ncbi:SufE family protein [Opitutales bacterium ASA1]|uniref:SufE family protein n=1 Tax=Congregicoccus parvus TaxID=3081749 RepID=UPI002B2FCF35|nr:SufE family protein [Opitutales bacterium ASA1]
MTAPLRPSDPLEELALLPDPQERLLWITDRGRRAPGLAPEERTPDRRVPGCVSPVWIVDASTPATCSFRCDADAPIVRGLAALVCRRASGRTPREVAGDSIDIVATLELARHLTPTRVNGLRALQEFVRRCAARHVDAP